MWKATSKKYLFNAFALAKLFRGKLLYAIAKVGLKLPADIPKKLVVDCRHTRRGESALEYLSRYLYRGVVSESNIIANRDGKVTFQYTDDRSKEARTETLDGENFMWRIIQHVLPRGFQRVRSYGFLHHNARKLLHLLQLILRVVIKPNPKQERPVFCCSACGQPMVVTGVSYRAQVNTAALKSSACRQMGRLKWQCPVCKRCSSVFATAWSLMIRVACDCVRGINEINAEHA